MIHGRRRVTRKALDVTPRALDVTSLATLSVLETDMDDYVPCALPPSNITWRGHTHVNGDHVLLTAPTLEVLSGALLRPRTHALPSRWPHRHQSLSSPWIYWSRYKLSWASYALSLSSSLISPQRWRRRRRRSLRGKTKSRARIADATKGRSVAGARGAPDADSTGLQYMEPAVHAKQRSESSEHEIRCERRVHKGVNACSRSCGE